MRYPDSRAFIDWDPQGHRLVSTILDPNIAGAMLMIGLLVQLARLSVGTSQPPWRVLVMFVALTLTLSRGAAMGLVVGSFVLLAARGLSRRLLRAALVAGILVAAVSPLLLRYGLAYGKFSLGQGSSAALRIETWLEMIHIIADYPIFGVGFNSYKYALIHFGLDRPGTSSYGGDGGLLFIMAMTGIVGLIVYCLMLRQIIARCRSIWRDRSVAPGNRGIAIGTAASIVAIVVDSASANAILTTFIMEMLWVLSGLTFVIARARDQRSVGDTDPGRSRAVAMAA
jgi:O-antigen ligase